MAKINTKQIIEYLKEAGASEEDIPVLAMTAYYESNFDTHTGKKYKRFRFISNKC